MALPAGQACAKAASPAPRRRLSRGAPCARLRRARSLGATGPAGMLTAFRLALEDTLAPEQRRAIALSLVLAALLLALLWLGTGVLLAHSRVAGIWWLDRLIALAGGAAALVLAWMLFPALALLILGFFLDGILAALESRRYPGLGPIRRRGAAAGLAGALRLLGLTLLLNLLALPFYLIPPINLFIYYLLNGYLIGRGYFEVVALRRVDEGVARAMWRRHRGGLVLAGVAVLFLLSMPLVNLVAPVMAAAFMLHVFEGLRRGEAAETFARSH
ncbi:MAG TPA: EI24 domain-containing protein [Stellaceae bacterium]|nr:EI24 domain-containing protein [Stellaceae bacterium]